MLRLILLVALVVASLFSQPPRARVGGTWIGDKQVTPQNGPPAFYRPPSPLIAPRGRLPPPNPNQPQVESRRRFYTTPAPSVSIPAEEPRQQCVGCPVVGGLPFYPGILEQDRSVGPSSANILSNLAEDRTTQPSSAGKPFNLGEGRSNEPIFYVDPVITGESDRPIRRSFFDRRECEGSPTVIYVVKGQIDDRVEALDANGCKVEVRKY